MTDKAIPWCGIDVSDKTFDVGLVLDQKISEFDKVPSVCFKRTKGGVSKFLIWLADQLQKRQVTPAQIGIVMESTGRLSLELYALLHEGGHEWHSVAIVNPRQVKSFIDSLSKT